MTLFKMTLAAVISLAACAQDNVPELVVSAARVERDARAPTVRTTRSRENIHFVPSNSFIPRQKETAGSAISLQRLAVKIPRSASKAYERGRKYMSDGKREKALAEYQKATEIAPDFVEAHSALGTLYAQLHRYVESTSEFRRAIELAPEETILHSNLGWLLLAQGKPDEAEASARQALSIAGNSARAHRLLGHVLAEDPTRRVEAIEHLESAVDLMAAVADGR